MWDFFLWAFSHQVWYVITSTCHKNSIRSSDGLKPPMLPPPRCSPPSAPARLSVGAQATSLSVSSDTTTAALRVVVAGRDVLQTCTADARGVLVEDLNLLQHTRRHATNHASNDVLWFPQRPSQLVTGASSGALLLWDTVRLENSKTHSETHQSSSLVLSRWGGRAAQTQTQTQTQPQCSPSVAPV